MNIKALNILRGQLSKNYYKCKDGCFECCTSVPLIAEEIVLMKKELRRNWYTDPPNGKGDLYCEFLTTEWRCSVYNQRPIICRSFSGTKFRMTKWDRSVLTPSCTYGDWRIKEATKEFIEYWKELMKDGYVTDNTKHILKSI